MAAFPSTGPQPAASAADDAMAAQARGGALIVTLMDALEIEKAVLAGFDWGSRTVGIVVAPGGRRLRRARVRVPS
ncbi:hypothetical protein ACFC0C_30980 [Streptomyces sp. NPDC056178]|uniref:hypothetical protein n=1 Tax=Streptomyces sp. NPDC056178 TaxID=3345735 RepID=UPI0035D5AEBF